MYFSSLVSLIPKRIKTFLIDVYGVGLVKREEKVITSLKLSCEIVGLISISKRIKKKNVHLLKIKLLLQIGGGFKHRYASLT